MKRDNCCSLFRFEFRWIIPRLSSVFTLLLDCVILVRRDFDGSGGSLFTESSAILEKYACYNSILEISCGEDELLVFGLVRYGRNNTFVASKCDVPFSRNCDIDVHFPVNRACAGKRRCSLEVTSAVFADPCGYEEFLTVTYECVNSFKIQSGCSGSNPQLIPTHRDHGYISSPNYPYKYYMDAVCSWIVMVRKWQTIRITMLDFELDVKRNGQCHDWLEIISGSKVLFRECGALGRQVVDATSNMAVITFNVGQTSLTQRGFFLYFEAVGPGCPDLPEQEHGWTVYYYVNDDDDDDDDVLYANVTCNIGFRFSVNDSNSRQIKCVGQVWNSYVSRCEKIPHTRPELVAIPSSTLIWSDLPSVRDANFFRNRTSVIDFLQSYYGITLSCVVSVLLLMIISLLSFYLYQRRSDRSKRGTWTAVVVNSQKDKRPNDSCIDLSLEERIYCHLANDSRCRQAVTAGHVICGETGRWNHWPVKTLLAVSQATGTLDLQTDPFSTHENDQPDCGQCQYSTMTTSSVKCCGHELVHRPVSTSGPSSNPRATVVYDRRESADCTTPLVRNTRRHKSVEREVRGCGSYPPTRCLPAGGGATRRGADKSETSRRGLKSKLKSSNSVNGSTSAPDLLASSVHLFQHPDFSPSSAAASHQCTRAIHEG